MPHDVDESVAGGEGGEDRSRVGVEPGIEPAGVRRLWHLLEPLHAVLYYAPEVFEEANALGYDKEERWSSYFPLRAAPLGPVGAEAVTSAFYSYDPGMVAEHMDGAWAVASPGEVLEARLRGIDRAYRSLFGELMDRPELAEAAALARTAAEAVEGAGRPLAAANAALDWPEPPHLQLWHAATILREHRGDGHLAALLVAELDPTESLVSFAAIGAASTERFVSRGWSPRAWTAAHERLLARGLLNEDGTATDAGRDLRHRVEHLTDRLAAAPWNALGRKSADRLTELLGDYWVAVLASGLLPSENTLGIGRV
ncbi:hypothetical protein [Streptomyces sp. NPDC088789]|uniref:SCO6745 family protein n=1 Tax=Streptomyces sp. NPDC088789 TaxID=3365899 RepID=UPI0038072C50